MSHVDPDQLHGVLNDFKGFVNDPGNAATMKANGSDPTIVLSKLDAIQTNLGGKKFLRDKAKTDYDTAQSDFTDTAASHYQAFSNLVDHVAGVVGKETPAGKQVLHYRKRMTGSSNHRNPAPTPTPAAQVASVKT